MATAAQLKAALGAAGPGDTIHLADGTYTGNFKATTPATASARITLTGSPRAVPTVGGGYGLHPNGASYWTVSGMTGANYDDSWVDVKGDIALVQDNTGTRTSNDGYQTHTQQSGWGCGTVFRGNKSTLTGATGSTQLAINVTNYSTACRTTVYSSNTVTGGKGLTDIPVVP